jgi:alanyl-tRNA synthetase
VARDGRPLARSAPDPLSPTESARALAGCPATGPARVPASLPIRLLQSPGLAARPLTEGSDYVTERLYYTDPYLTEFDASVIAVEALDGGRRAAVLDRTAFYPTSGGQPFDTGSLSGARVIDVIDRDDGVVLHVVEGEVSAGAVRGRIDWARRFDHMQQHTGQHVLSAAFDRLMGARTVSFHLGSSSSTIDLSREVSAAEIARAETDANRVVWEDRPVTIRFADAAEAAALPLRKEPARGGVLRLIDVQDFDVSACGGTHVARTGAIGIIAIPSSERFRGGTRVEFVCGARALGAYRLLRDSMAESIRLLSVVPSELAAGIERVQSEAKELKRQVKDLQTKLAAHEGAALASRAEAIGSLRAVVAALEGWDQSGLKAIAAAIAERAGHVAVLISTPAPSAVVVARAADVAVDSAAILKQLTARFGGKGGGRPELAQGGGLEGPRADVLSAASAILAAA